MGNLFCCLRCRPWASGLGTALETGKTGPNLRLSRAVVPDASRPGKRWQEAAGSSELFLAAAGAAGSRREERRPCQI